MIKIHSQNDLDVLLTIPNWEDAFLRECHLLSPSYINPTNQTIIASDSAPTIRMLICTSELKCPGLELIFKEVEEMYFSCRNDLNPVAIFGMNRIIFSFHGDNAPEMQSKALYYRVLDNDCWGWQTRYGIKNIFDQGGFLEEWG